MKVLKNFTKLALGVLTGYIITRFTWVFWQLAKADPRFTLLVPQNKAPKGISSVQGRTGSSYNIQHVIEDGIERISYLPHQTKYKTPILMIPGMWHGAWCWQAWQELLADWGWENHAISLPGHGKSPEQRPIPLCTLDYYLGFIRDEVKKMEREPILMGHSMGGALTQWYLKYIGDNLPAAVFVASWVSHSVREDGGATMLKQDPAITLFTALSWDATSWVRNPQRTAEKLLGPQAVVSPQKLHSLLGPESMLVALQHNPPFWRPPENIQTPNYWLAGEFDTVASVPGLRKSADFYGGDFVLVPGAGHNLMMEHNYVETAETIHKWLLSQEIE
jgi:pimeloyl-ACP methyl ester carboxylesterase